MSLPGPVSIIDSLTRPLPSFSSELNTESKVSKGSDSIQLMPPPKLAIPRAASNLWHLLGAKDLDQNSQIGVAFANQVKSVNPKEAGAAEVLAHAKAFFQDKKYFVPEREENITHANEADVVRSADLYLIHPVMSAIAAHPRYYHQVLSKAEDTLRDSRTDMTFYQPVAPNKEHRPFAIVEYKKRDTFRASDFDHMSIIKRSVPKVTQADFDLILANPPTQQSADTFKQLFEACGVKADDPESTLFSGSANNLIKQAASYMVAYRVKYVALFNWDCMVLCYFPWLDLKKSAADLENLYKPRPGTRGTPARAGLPYPVEVDVYPKDDAKTRIALMSFMQHAWEETYNSL